MAVFIGGMRDRNNDRDKFFNQYDKLSESDKLALQKELEKEIKKVDNMNFFKITDDKKAKQIYRQKMIQAFKRAYKKFGIDFRASLLPNR